MGCVRGGGEGPGKRGKGPWDGPKEGVREKQPFREEVTTSVEGRGVCYDCLGRLTRRGSCVRNK